MDFNEQEYGYNKDEVNQYIEKIKATYEAKLMEEKLKTLEAEHRLLKLRNEHLELENKEQNILNALDVLEKAKKFEEEDTKSFYALVFDKIELLIQELDLRFPELKKNQNFGKVLKEFKDISAKFKDKFVVETNVTSPVNLPNDSMRVLLNKMQDYRKGQDTPKEIKLQTAKQKEPESSSGFSLEEALNPKDDLSEIMKAFDFYNK